MAGSTDAAAASVQLDTKNNNNMYGGGASHLSGLLDGISLNNNDSEATLADDNMSKCYENLIVIDAGANLTNKKYSRDLDSVVQRAKDAGECAGFWARSEHAVNGYFGLQLKSR